jgi:hypothetical protein
MMLDAQHLLFWLQWCAGSGWQLLYYSRVHGAWEK